MEPLISAAIGNESYDCLFVPTLSYNKEKGGGGGGVKGGGGAEGEGGRRDIGKVMVISRMTWHP